MIPYSCRRYMYFHIGLHNFASRLVVFKCLALQIRIPDSKHFFVNFFTKVMKTAVIPLTPEMKFNFPDPSVSARVYCAFRRQKKVTTL